MKQVLQHMNVFILLSVCVVSSAQAVDAQLLSPALTSMGVQNQSNQTKEAGRLQTGFLFHVTRNPLEFTFTNDDRFDDLLNWWATANVMFSYDVSSFMSLQVDLPIYFVSIIEPLNSTSKNIDIGLGDIRLSAPIVLRSFGSWENENRKLGIGLTPFVSFPTGDANRFEGGPSYSGGATLLLDRWLATKHYFSWNLGYHMRKQGNILNLEIDDELLSTIGYALVMGKKRTAHAFVEVHGRTPAKGLFASEIQSPLEVTMGFKKYWFKRQWSLTVGAGRGLNNGYGAPDFRVFTGVTYHGTDKQTPEPIKQPIIVEAVTEDPKTRIYPTVEDIPTHLIVYFDTDDEDVEADFYDQLNTFAKGIQPYIDRISLRVIGHTDARGSQAHNQKLSQERARNVASFLQSYGTPSSIIESSGQGFANLAEIGDSLQVHQQNRRVEIWIKKNERLQYHHNM